MRRFTSRSAWIAATVVGVSSAAALLVRHGGVPMLREPAAPAPVQVAASDPPPSMPKRATPGDDPPPQQAPIPFSARIYPATPLPPAPPAKQRPEATTAAPAAPPSGGVPAATEGFFSQALPAGTPISMLLDRLKAAADSGDRDAACRVGMELARCSAGAPMVAATTSGAVLMQPQCAGVSPTDLQSAPRYLAQAAAAGSDAARRALAGDSSVRPTECGR